MIGAFKGLSPLGEGVMDGSTGSPTLFQAMPGETEIRGRLPPHPTLLSYLSSVFSPQHIIWRQGRDYKNSQLITDNSQLITNPVSYFLTQADPRLREDDVSRASFPSP